VAQVYRYRRQIGVNLGCVFILERWLCPLKLCQQVPAAKGWESEHDFLKSCSSPQEARRILEDHWETYVTQDDMAILASKGINTIRLPIGYWIVQRSLLVPPFASFEGVYDSAWNWFLRTIHMAAQYGIGVLVDLHGAPGGQNSDTHCGVSTGRAEFFTNPHYQEVTLEVLCTLAHTLVKINNVVGLELLNEPTDHPSLEQFYERALTKLSYPDTIGLPLYISDCWNPDGKYTQWLQSRLQLIVMDTHQYFCHTPRDHARSALQHTQDLKTLVRDRVGRARDQLAGCLVVGEWSVVLNHQSIPAHENDANVMRDFGKAELQVWDQVSAGNFYW
ncbi:glycoside hydrolase family 5 protein, partial [Phycomyces blakesleeanus NRRL 1555(-)]